MKKTKVILSLLVLALTGCGFEVIDQGSRGIKTSLGQIQGEPLPPGFYTYNPFTSTIHEYPVRQQTFTDKTSTATKDNQMVNVEIAVIWAPITDQVDTLWSKTGWPKDVEEKVLKNNIQGIMKDSIGTVDSGQLTEKRAAVAQMALSAMKDALRKQSIDVIDFQFTSLSFHEAFQRAVEEKVVAIQEAQKAVNVTASIREQAKQTILSAQADAEAMKIKSQALAQNRGLIEYEYAKRWDGKLPQTIMGAGSVPFINLNSKGRLE